MTSYSIWTRIVFRPHFSLNKCQSGEPEGFLVHFRRHP